MKCYLCSSENDDKAKFCAECGSEFAVTNAGAGVAGNPSSASRGDLGAIAAPETWELGPPSRKLFDRPLTSDWVFWVFVALTLVFVGPNLYRTGRGYANWDAGSTLAGGFFDVGLGVLMAFVIFALIPALIRSLVRRSRDRRSFAAIPFDPEQGWKVDPLNAARVRWWNGERWTRAVRPSHAKGVGGVSWLVIAGLVIALAGIFIAGRSSVEAPRAGEIVDGSSSNPNIALVIGVYFRDLMDAVAEYSRTPIDVNRIEASMVDVRLAFEKVEVNYILLSQTLPAVQSQAQLGPNAPDLNALRAFVDAMGPYVQVRLDFYAALDQCGPMAATRSWGRCEFDVYDQWESVLVRSIPPVADAFGQLQESLPAR